MKQEIHVLSLGHDTELLSGNKSMSDGAKRRMNFAERIGSYTSINLTRKSEGSFEHKCGNIRVISTNGSNVPHALWRMYRLGCSVCKEGKVNVIQTQEACTTGLVGHLLKLRYKLPISICVYGPNPWDSHWRRASIFNFLITPFARHILHRADRIIADGSLTLDRLRQVGIANERLVWKVNVPSNIDEFVCAEGDELRHHLLGEKFQHLLLCVGSMSVQKNIPFVLRVFKCIVKQMPKTRLVMIGSGRRKKIYIKLARRLHLEEHILWIDAVPHEEIPTYFKACNLLILGSRYEGFPRVLVEAAAASRAIVATEVSGCTDGMIHNESGFVVEQGDKDGFVDRVVELLDNPEQAAIMGRRGQALIQKLSFKRESFNRKQVEVWEDISQFSKTENMTV